jgi:hypothetical protein
MLLSTAISLNSGTTILVKSVNHYLFTPCIQNDTGQFFTFINSNIINGGKYKNGKNVEVREVFCMNAFFYKTASQLYEIL